VSKARAQVQEKSITMLATNRNINLDSS